MKILKPNTKAFTALELMIVILTVAVMVALLLPPRPKQRNTRIHCLNNLKNVGIGFRLWADDHGGKFPMEISTNAGGTRGLPGDPGTIWQFQILAKVLGDNARLLACPADGQRSAATTFLTNFDNTHVSYFIGLDANETLTNAFLAGDRNLQNGGTPRSGILPFTPAQPIGWGKDIHKEQGNVLFVDGRVARLDSRQVRSSLADTGLATNRLAFP